MRKASGQDLPFDRVYQVVRSIPHGRVLTYGRISNLIEGRLSPLAVGWALHQCPKTVPWHRVVNASGGCSTDQNQQNLLEQEGIQFRPNGSLDLTQYLWHP